MTRCLITILTILTLVECQIQSPLRKFEPVRQPKLSYDTTRLTIIKYEKAGHFYDDYGYTIGKFEQMDLTVIDSLVHVAVAVHNDKMKEEDLAHRMIDLKNGNYRQQLLALFGTSKRQGTVRGMRITWGQKGVDYAWVNCFCSRKSTYWDSYWRTEVIRVSDGGSCFFNLMIDLTNKKYLDMDVNGR